jgi:ABC-type molybdenum transport system ATPase subunit/photorepair protein PhrA
MPRAHIVVSSPIVVTSKVLQLRGIFDVPPSENVSSEWDVDLPLDERTWNVGLIVGPSGAGKTTIARELFADALMKPFEWDKNKAIVDCFDSESIKDVIELLSSVGFSSPPSWLKPFHVLSNGEQFRVNIARALSENKQLTVVDEFTSVVDRTVAQIGSAAIARTVRKRNQQFIAATCHYDVIDWLQPDWAFEPHIGKFYWRDLQRRPAISLDIKRVSREAWEIFASHHYLSRTLTRSSRCFVAFWNNMPVAFTAVIYLPHATLKNSWREHRTVCLPDFQGVGIGNAMSDAIGSLIRGLEGRYYSRTSAPGMIVSRRRSKNWKTTIIGPCSLQRSGSTKVGQDWTADLVRQTVGFEYVGSKMDSKLAWSLWNEKV